MSKLAKEMASAQHAMSVVLAPLDGPERAFMSAFMKDRAVAYYSLVNLTQGLPGKLVGQWAKQGEAAWKAQAGPAKGGSLAAGSTGRSSTRRRRRMAGRKRRSTRRSTRRR